MTPVISDSKYRLSIVQLALPSFVLVIPVRGFPSICDLSLVCHSKGITGRPAGDPDP